MLEPLVGLVAWLQVSGADCERVMRCQQVFAPRMIQQDVKGSPIGQREWPSASYGYQFFRLHHCALVCGNVD